MSTMHNVGVHSVVTHIVIAGTFRNPCGLVCPLDASGMLYCEYNLTMVFSDFLAICQCFRNYPHSTSLMLQHTSHTFNPDTQACHIVRL